jgi:hypothetical protein
MHIIQNIVYINIRYLLSDINITTRPGIYHHLQYRTRNTGTNNVTEGQKYKKKPKLYHNVFNN